MHPGLPPALFTLCTSLAMAVCILARRCKEPLHWMLFGHLAGIALWMVGVVQRFTVTANDELAVALRIIFTGILLASACWLLAAVCYARRRSSSDLANLAIPVFMVASLFALAVFTNDGHRLLIRKVDLAALESGPRAFTGPLYWAFVVWVYGCVAGGMILYLREARTMILADSRRRGILLATASVVPAAASTVYTFQIVPIGYDLTPSGLVLSLILLCLAVFRYQLFESLPLARDAALAHLDDGVVMASARGRITEWNPAAARILDSPLLRRGSDLAALLAQALPAPEGRVVEVTTAAVDDGRGVPAGQFAILSDRTEIDRIEQLARQTQRLEIVGALAGEVAHHINDPLTYVRANLVEIERLGARVDAEGAGPDAELAEQLADLRAVAIETLEGVERIRRIVDGMRELSSAERADFAEVELCAVARDALRRAQPAAQLASPGEGPEVGLLLRAVPTVHGNAERLAQVVLNLLVNARQALAGTAGAQIRIETSRRGGEVELAVSDNGPGIPETLRHRIFDPFFTTRGPEGTGLGLAIAFDIAREHGGALEVRSLPGKGARFVLRLPALGAGDAARATGSWRQVEHRLE